jgi:hypothetical protein
MKDDAAAKEAFLWRHQPQVRRPWDSSGVGFRAGPELLKSYHTPHMYQVFSFLAKFLTKSSPFLVFCAALLRVGRRVGGQGSDGDEGGGAQTKRSWRRATS